MTKYLKGLQRTTKEHKRPQRTAREHRAGPQSQMDVIEAHLSTVKYINDISSRPSQSHSCSYTASISRLAVIVQNSAIPPKRNRVRFPCGVCNKACREDIVKCDDCNTWVHRTCLQLSTDQFQELGKTDVPL